MLDARGWLLWVLTILIAASSGRNPLYGALLMLVITVVGTVCSPRDGQSDHQWAILSPLRFATIAIPISALFNALTVHAGDTALFRLPGWLPLVGGLITLEALVFGVLNGLVLTIIFAGFAVFNQITPARDLARLTPRAFHEVGVIIAIALTYVPQTVHSLRRIRQAQAVRGHRMRGLRDWPPIVVPLLVSGLERSMGLAEAMVARGYGAIADRAQPLRTSVGLVLGLLVLLCGWLMRLFRLEWRGVGTALMIGGGALIIGVVWFAGRSVRHPSYRSHRWTVRDTLVVAGCAVALAPVVLPSAGADSRYYSPYPRLALPVFDPLVGLALLGLLVPAIVSAARAQKHHPSPGDAAIADETGGQ